MEQVWGIVVDCGNFNFLKDNKYPSLSEPDASYNNIKFAETFMTLVLP